jgi:hypothetical protein
MNEDFPSPWYRLLDEKLSLLLQDEISKELGNNHLLAGLPLKVIARRDDRDDVLVALGGDGRVAEVHLTWSRKKESDPRWPKTTVYESLAEWSAENRNNMGSGENSSH